MDTDSFKDARVELSVVIPFLFLIDLINRSKTFLKQRI